jgi:uncharacterized protein YbjT (DUF2867 family)
VNVNVMAEREIVAVAGATGRQGGAVARNLLAAGYRVRALTRKPGGDAARALAARGAELAELDFDDAGSVERGLAGAWGAFAVQNPWEPGVGVEREERQGKAFAERARAQGVQCFVYSSVGSAHRRTGIPHFESKWRVEETVRGLGFPAHVILRPVFFMENVLAPSFGVARGKLVLAVAPTTRIQMLAAEDLGRFAALAFDRHRELGGRAIDIAGDELTLPEAAAILTEVLGTKVEFERDSIEKVRARSEDSALNFEWFDRVGYDVDIATLERDYGLPLTRFRAWATANRALLAKGPG